MPGTTGAPANTALNPPARGEPAMLPQVDRYLLIMRWAAVLGVIILALEIDGSLLRRPAAQTPLTTAAALVLSTLYNLLISLFVWWKQPLTGRRAGWILVGDVLLATLATWLTGGDRSVFYPLFLIAVIEAALLFPWGTSLGLTAGICLLQLAALLYYPAISPDTVAAASVIAKSFVVLLLGGLITLASRQMSRERRARQEATWAAQRTTALHEIFLHLEDLEVDHIMASILKGTQLLSHVTVSLVLLPDLANGRWVVAAASGSHPPADSLLRGLGWPETGPEFYCAGAGYPLPLPPAWDKSSTSQMVGVRMRLPSGDTLGAILLGRQTPAPLRPDEKNSLSMLAQEASLTLRNAQLFAREQAQVVQLQRFEEAQTAFFSAIAHELKTPLTVLKTLVPSLSRLPQLPLPTQAEISQTIEKNLARLESSISTLLESTRLEAQAVSLYCQPVNLRLRVKHVLAQLSPLLNRKRRRIKVRADARLPHVWADGRRVEQILTNLIDNAIKFAPADSEIEITLEHLPGWVQVSVADAGPGVPQAEREHIFDKFYTIAGESGTAGTGLGLYICRELVHLHQGRIWVEARPGGGSRFCFTLPLAAEHVENA